MEVEEKYSGRRIINKIMKLDEYGFAMTKPLLTGYFKHEKKILNLEYKHGTIIRTRITCKTTSCYMLDSACRWLIVKNIKIFRRYVKHF